MKKSTILLGLFIIYLGLAFNSIFGYDDMEFKSSDELLVEKYCEEEYPETDFNQVCIIQDRTNSDFIGFQLIDDDDIIFDGILDREYALKQIEK